MNVGLIEAIPDPITRKAVYELWKAAREVARDLDPRLEAVEGEISGCVQQLQFCSNTSGSDSSVDFHVRFYPPPANFCLQLSSGRKVARG